MANTVAHLGNDQVRRLRLASLLHGGHQHQSVADVVTWMGALQAQDHASGLWSLGMRVPGATEHTVAEALEQRDVLRTWPMRGTVHWVPARDAHWMLDLMSSRPLATAPGRQEALGLSPSTVDAATHALVDALSGGRRLTREACIDVMRTAGAPSTSGVAYHLLWFAAQRGITCITPHLEGKQTFALLDEWVPDPRRPSRDEALALIAHRYVRSHGPVTVNELARWTGLGMRDCRAGIAAVSEHLVEVGTEAGPMVVDRDVWETAAGGLDEPTGWWAMPSFDEYLLGYKDRDLMLDPDLREAVIPGNRGVFRWTVVRDGEVVATWKRTRRARGSRIDVKELVKLTAADRRHGDEALARYGAFLEESVDVQWEDV